MKKLKKIKMLLVASSLMGSLSFFNCFATEKNYNEENNVFEEISNMLQEDDEGEKINTKNFGALTEKQVEKRTVKSAKCKLIEEIESLTKQNRLLKKILKKEKTGTRNNGKKEISRLLKAIDKFDAKIFETQKENAECIERIRSQKRMNEDLLNRVNKWSRRLRDLSRME